MNNSPQSMEKLVYELIIALEVIAVGDIHKDVVQQFADSVLVELGIWEEKENV